MRDIGGYHTKSNDELLYGKIIRSSALTNITNEQIKRLLDLNIRTIIDLRTSEEIEKNPINFKCNPAFSFYHCQIKGGDKIPTSKAEVANSYINMLEDKNSIYQVFKIIEENENGVIYFCTAGKDRTGVITALLLDLLDIEERDIIKDYQTSDTPALEKYKLNAGKEIAEVITPKPEYIKNFLAKVQENYGGTRNYLLSTGLTEEELQNIERKIKNVN